MHGSTVPSLKYLAHLLSLDMYVSQLSIVYLRELTEAWLVGLQP